MNIVLLILLKRNVAYHGDAVTCDAKPDWTAIFLRKSYLDNDT